MSPLSYVVDGPLGAPVLLLGSSLGATTEMWSPQVPALAHSRRVVRFDHRGHGGSPVPPGPYTIDDLGGDVLALADHLGIGRFHYAGLSLGGMVGMWLATRAPERIETLTLLCTSAFLPPAEAWLDRAATVRRAGLAAVAEAVLARWFTPAFTNVEPYRQMLLRTPVEGYAACCEAIAALDLRPDLGAIDVPTLVIAGALDPATPPEMGRRIASAVPGARFVEVAGAAHLANVERADVVTELLATHVGV